MFGPLLALVLMALQPQSGVNGPLYPKDTSVTLTGRVNLLHGYGPPGWGEDPKHDAHIVYWAIDLPATINTPCKPARPEWTARDCQSTKRLRLIVESDEHLLAEAKAVRGQRAAVTGVLHRQDTAGEMTPIFMDPTEIRPLL
jgi:hypothetical protein